MPDRPREIDILIVGAGMTGLAAAEALKQTNLDAEDRR
jgi:cation diffusion facilitator CzcD-associated flavoprotein CzcO